MRVRVAPLAPGDEAEFVAAARASRALHGAWVTPPTTVAAFRERLARLQPPDHLALAVRRTDDGRLAGCIEITQIVRGALCSAYLGYYAFEGHARQGLMREAVGRAVRLAFGRLRLHRLEANIQPGNRASIALVRSCGFHREGFSPAYLKIRGRWRDHERWAILARR